MGTKDEGPKEESLDFWFLVFVVAGQPIRCGAKLTMGVVNTNTSIKIYIVSC